MPQHQRRLHDVLSDLTVAEVVRVRAAHTDCFDSDEDLVRSELGDRTIFDHDPTDLSEDGSTVG